MFRLPHFFTAWLLCLSFVSCLPVVAPGTGAHALLSRGGPSGYVQQPAGGAEYLNLGGLGEIYVEYQGVEGTLSDGTTYNTVAIDVTVHDPTGYQADKTIVQGFKPNGGSGTLISGYFTPPGDACGTYQLVIVEHQFIYDTVIAFQAAAPTISIECGPIQ